MKTIYHCAVVLLFATIWRKGQMGNASPPAQSEAMFGYKLEIELKTNVVSRGDTLAVLCHVKNDGTNDVVFARANPNHDFELLLQDNMGRRWRISEDPASKAVFMNSIMQGIKPGETYTRTANCSIPRATAPGDYYISCRMAIFVSNKLGSSVESSKREQHYLGSNAVELKVE